VLPSVSVDNTKFRHSHIFVGQNEGDAIIECTLGVWGAAGSPPTPFENARVITNPRAKRSTKKSSITYY